MYRAYLLRVQSDVQLPAPPGKGGKPDVCIRRRSLSVCDVNGTAALQAPRSNGSDHFNGSPTGGDAGDVGDAEEVETFVGDTGQVITGGIYDELYFVVQHGDTIYYDLRKPLPSGALQGYLFGVLMATLLRQRGFLVLHACSVARDGKAVAFVGESGWGKSTLAEYFCQRGYTLLSDDVLAIDTSPDAHDTRADARAQVIPGYPQIRLRAEAGRHLRADFDALPVVNEENEKRFTTPDAFPERPLPLQQMYLLDPTYAEATRVEPVEQRTALLRLINHTRATNLVKEADFQSQLFRQCERVVQQVPIQRLHRARDLDRLDEIAEQVERDLGIDAPPFHRVDA